jgi:sacsin
MKLNKMHKYKKQLDVSYCLNALDGLFGFSKDTLESGNFSGTLFRFPFREEKTALSDNVYSKAKILDLFKAFQAEASVELLFLKCLENIQIYIKNLNGMNSSDVPLFSVSISDNCLDDVREKRSVFHCHMKSIGGNHADSTLKTSFHVTIGTQSETESRNEKVWLVLHCLKGGNMSQELLALSQDESLSYSPYVSIAMPLHDDPEFKGHVFCLMPLPLEGISLTGFPVHVNGYFSLSQNRRCVKWPTADLVGNKTNTDKSINWNKCLVMEVLADVYLCVIQQLIQRSKENNNSDDDVAYIYRAIPDYRKITNHWDLISDPFFNQLLKTSFLYTENNGGNWIGQEQAVFQIFQESVTKGKEYHFLLKQITCILQGFYV